MHLAKFLTITVLFIVLTISDVYSGDTKRDRRAAEHWTYGRQAQDKWAGSCNTGKRQSPIDINTNDVVNVHYDDVMWSGNATTFGDVTLKNSGHGFSVSGKNMGKMRLHGAGLEAEYVLAQFHYHWGPTPTDRVPFSYSLRRHDHDKEERPNKTKRSAERLPNQGSEHLVDGFQHPAELHLVHFHSDFRNLSHALQSGRGDALAVVGVLLEREEGQARGFETNLLEAVNKVHKIGATAQADFSSVKIGDLVPSDLTHFWRYDGSLTTPDCNEQVIWTVLEEEATISGELLDCFNRLQDSGGHNLNYTGRDPEQLFGRMVEYNMGTEHGHEHGHGHGHEYGLGHQQDDDAGKSGSSLMPTVLPWVTLLNFLRACVF